MGARGLPRGALPNFLIVGAQKCGTTSLHEILSQHPEVVMSEVKEVNYFTNTEKYQQGLGYYASFFPQNTQAKAIGEASPGYLCYPDVHQLIHQDLGDIKIVILLRDPIKRAYSQYWDNRRQLKETSSETEIIDQYLEAEYSPQRKGYFSRGVYYKDVKKYMDQFGDENVQVIIFESLIKNQQTELQKLYKFLGLQIDQGYQQLPKPSNSAVIWKNPLFAYFLQHPEKTRYLPTKFRRLLRFGKQEKFKYPLPGQAELDKLKAFYQPWNKKLEDLLSIQLVDWIR